ncbi:MAG TPA: hypothetical protein VHE35_17885 [Kofleriaceae bacterium]|nr:hypothetical protein [Kofleriaceae bacterium]
MRRPAISLLSTLAVLALAAGPAAAEPHDFGPEARLLYRVVACGGTAPVPDGIDAATVDAHCKQVAALYPDIERRYLAPARALFATLRPANLPTTVVYPFGGGDLLSALVTYPDAREITTLSLEHAGDPTRLAGASKADLKRALATYRDVLRELFANHDSASDNMKKLERGPVPGQLGMFLAALVAHGYEPVSLRYFRVEPDGSLHYFDDADLAAMAPVKAKRKRGKWVDPDYSAAFSNAELTFRKAGDPTAPLIVHRHIAADLSDGALRGSPVQAYLEQRGPIVAMTKAASYLLWLGAFSTIRDYLLAHMVWMASDATGIPPRWAKKAGFVQTTYGRFDGAYLDDAVGNEAEDAFRKLWHDQPYRKLGFRYGYPDSKKQVHLLVTAKAGP